MNLSNNIANLCSHSFDGVAESIDHATSRIDLPRLYLRLRLAASKSPPTKQNRSKFRIDCLEEEGRGFEKRC